MIEINLLPDLYRNLKKTKEQNIPLNLILLSINAVLIVVFLIVTGLNVSKIMTLHALEIRLKGLAPEQQKIILLQQKSANFKNTNALFSPLVTNRFLWAKKLNVLSDLMVQGVWLRNLSLERKTPQVVPATLQPPAALPCELKIEATVVSAGQDEMAIIGEFIKNLKGNEDFFKDFKTIELDTSLRRQIAVVEVMDFTLRCVFKDDIQL